MKNIVLVFALLLPGFAEAIVSIPQEKTANSAVRAKAFTANYVVFRNGKDLGTATIKYADAGNDRWELSTHTLGKRSGRAESSWPTFKKAPPCAMHRSRKRTAFLPCSFSSAFAALVRVVNAARVRCQR